MKTIRFHAPRLFIRLAVLGVAGQALVFAQSAPPERDSKLPDANVESVSVHIPGLAQTHCVLRVRRHSATFNSVPQDADR